MRLQRLLREPLLHFLVLGALLFGLYGWLNRDALRSPAEVVVDRAQVQALATQFQRVWQRQPTADELRGLVDHWVREEIIFREGVAGGMERDDEVVRRRVIQKMSFMTDGMAADVPSDADLQAWLRLHGDRYRLPSRYTLQQAYFDPARHGSRLDADIEAATLALRRNPQARVGDPTLLPTALADASSDDLARTFGERFAAEVADMPDGSWAGPIVSGFGLHLVRIDSRTPGRLPQLAQVRAAVERDLLSERSREAADAFYQGLRKRYTVKMEVELDTFDGAASNPRGGKAATATRTQ
ncbi:MAG TPA: peptidylprolyl isomerase [Lysobacter sp.]